MQGVIERSDAPARPADRGTRRHPHREDDRTNRVRRLLTAACLGEEWAWQEIFDGHYERLYRFLRSRVDLDEVAEDLASDVFMEAYRSAGSLAEVEASPAGLGAWLFAIARERFAEYRGDRLRGDTGDAMRVLGYTRPEFLEADVRGLLDELEPADRIALELRYVIGLSGAEAAALMGCTEPTLRLRLLRATRAFGSESECRLYDLQVREAPAARR